jgi:hypothetical protein
MSGLPLAGVGHWEPVTGGIERWVPVVATSVAALPVAALVVVALTRYRRGRPDALARSVAEVAMTVGTLPWIWMIFTPLPEPARRLRLVPLLDIAGQLAGPLLFAAAQIVGNLLVFAAFGFFAPRRWPLSTATVVAIAGAASIAIEALQFLLGIGRVSSVDDVLLNTTGAALAALASRALGQAGPERSFRPGLTPD